MDRQLCKQYEYGYHTNFCFVFWIAYSGIKPFAVDLLEIIDS